MTEWVKWRAGKFEYLEHRIEGDDSDVFIQRGLVLFADRYTHVYDGYYTREVYGVSVKHVCNQEEYEKLWGYHINKARSLNTY